MLDFAMMTSTQIRQSFLDFFKSKQHTIVPSSSLMPDSPNLLFTNAGMNQFVPIFLGQTQCPYTPGRAADTQKCIRAGGKHNDLDDVGLDTYHHTFFEMLGNWSFGDYFKKEAIEWAWELVVGIWKFPPQRIYATVFCPHMDMKLWKDELDGAIHSAQTRLGGGISVYAYPKGSSGESRSDEEAASFWAEHFLKAGLDPLEHIVPGNKKDNFWMMGETGPCGPCSELHVDLTPAGYTKGSLVNRGDARCIEIWNLVFIQFNANPDGTFSPLPAKHVDTGMGFERVTSIIQGTKNLTDFANAKISNYETDIFRPIFDALEKLSGQKYTSTLPSEGRTVQGNELIAYARNSQLQVDIAFRVIADHIRTLTFAIADGIQPGNNDRNYVLRRILRRAVRYGRTLGFKEPFFYKLVDVLADTMGDVFPEIRARKKQVQETIQREEEAFNKTLDRGIALFEEEVERLLGSARVPRVVSGVAPETRSTNIPTTIESAAGSKYSKRNLPHFERPWAKYMVTFTTINHRQLSPQSRDLVLESLLFTDKQRRWEMFAACVMPDHVHVLFEPQIKEQDPDGKPVFWSLTELLHSMKSFTAHEINKVENTSGGVWEKESFDRMMRSAADLEEKFHYICRNPWDGGVVPVTEPYPWLWTPTAEMGSARVPRAVSGVAPETASSQTSPEKLVERSARRDASQGTPEACAPQISGAFAFRLYDEQGFPLDLTELMARERGLTVDKEGFEKLMEEQRARARAAQKKEVISLSQIETTTPTTFVGYEALAVPAKVLEVVSLKDKTAVILDASACYAEMGGQVGDTGELTGSGQLWRVTNTQKSGNAFLHFVEGGGDAPVAGSEIMLTVDKSRRNAIQRHHTVTHLLHWALHEVASKEASQKGSFVGPDKLTFDFNSAPLTPAQVTDIEKLVNERILENAGVSWTEAPYADVKSRKDVMQFFGDKYGDVVRVVQIGGHAAKLDGYSMELCGGTHTRATGEIGLFRIVGENAIAAGVRRIEAVAGLEAYGVANSQLQLIRSIAGKINSPVHELEKKIEALLAHQKELEKQVKAAQQREASNAASELLERVHAVNGIPAIIHNVGGVDGDFLQAVADSLKGLFKGVIVLGGATSGAVALVASVSSDFTAKVQAGKIIQQIAPIVGGKGGGKPDNARGGGKDASKLDEALAKAKTLL
jgi:alanyl-tRNA synthetase/REP element-mobilizing transposase RayT